MNKNIYESFYEELDSGESDFQISELEEKLNIKSAYDPLENLDADETAFLAERLNVSELQGSMQLRLALVEKLLTELNLYGKLLEIDVNIMLPSGGYWTLYC